VQCPDELDNGDSRPCVFLAGGISGCPDWQNQMKEMLNKQCPRLVLINPRRKKFDINDKAETPKQIQWEFKHLKRADAILFWFPAETLCPITLYELGSWIHSSKALFVGTHKNYARKEDVIVQTGLVQEGFVVVDDLQSLANRVTEWFNKMKT